MPERVLEVLDSHTAGMPTRLMLEGVPKLPGGSMSERNRFFEKHYDWIRTTAMQEPRGNPGVIALLVPPSEPAADYGLIFGDCRGYVDMCIHGTIGVVTTLYEFGLASHKKPKGELVFDTPAGLVRTRARFSEGKARSVSVSSVPSLPLGEEKIRIHGVGAIDVPIAFGGNIYAYVDARDLRTQVKREKIAELLSLGREILSKLGKFEIFHPTLSWIKGVTGVSIFQDHDGYSKNIMIGPNDLFDRSPCGTGTCGRLAVLERRGKLKEGQRFVNRGILDTAFVGRITGKTRVGGMEAIIPEITGSAYVTGVTELRISDSDPLRYGFNLVKQ